MKKSLTTVALKTRKIAAICGAVDTKIETAKTVCDALAVDYDSIDRDIHAAFVSIYSAKDTAKARAAAATILNKYLDTYAKVTASSWTVLQLTAATRIWSTAHKQYELSEANFRKNFMRCIYAEIVGAFHCPEQYDRALEATYALSDAQRFIDGVKTKGKDGAEKWKVKPAAMRINKLRSELAAMKKAHDTALDDRIKQAESALKALEKKLEDINLDTLAAAKALAIDTYKKAVDNELDDLAMRLQGGADMKEATARKRAEMVLNELIERDNKAEPESAAE